MAAHKAALDRRIEELRERCMGGHTGAAIAAAAYSEARWSPAPAGIAAFENKIVQWATARS
jgi:hypothetical protein